MRTCNVRMQHDCEQEEDERLLETWKDFCLLFTANGVSVRLHVMVQMAVVGKMYTLVLER